MRGGAWLVEPEHWDAGRMVADREAIRRCNPQRFEMEQLTAVVYEDVSRHLCVGYKDVTADELWVRGHVPLAPVMPLGLMCEAAAQLANYYAVKNRLYTSLGGLAGLKDVRCRGIVRPGDRLYVLGKLLKIRGTLLTCRFQCAVRKQLVCEGVLMGTVFDWAKDRGPDAAAKSAG